MDRCGNLFQLKQIYPLQNEQQFPVKDAQDGIYDWLESAKWTVTGGKVGNAGDKLKKVLTQI